MSTKAKSKSGHKPGSGPKYGGDHEGRMGSPIAGNPAQRKSQVQGIANGVMAEHETEPDPDDPNEAGEGEAEAERDPLFQGNHPSQASQSPIMHHHTVHNHTTGQSVTHSVPHGQICPTCGNEYIGGM